MNTAQLKVAFLNLMRASFPELRDGTHLPLKARVLAVSGAAGDVDAGAGPRLYSVDVQPLTPDGDDDPTRHPIRDVALEMGWPGPGARGLYHLPEKGSIVRVAFYGGSAAHPYVEGIVPDGWGVPAVRPGELLVQHRSGTTVRLTPEGVLEIELSETAAGGGDLKIVQRSDRAAANVTATQTAKLGGANRTLNLQDQAAGGNLTVTLDAPQGGTLNVTTSGAATLNAKGDVNINSVTGQVKLGGGGPPVARVGDPVVGGVITAGSSKVQAG